MSIMYGYAKGWSISEKALDAYPHEWEPAFHFDYSQWTFGLRWSLWRYVQRGVWMEVGPFTFGVMRWCAPSEFPGCGVDDGRDD